MYCTVLGRHGSHAPFFQQQRSYEYAAARVSTRRIGSLFGRASTELRKAQTGADS